MKKALPLLVVFVLLQYSSGQGKFCAYCNHETAGMSTEYRYILHCKNRVVIFNPYRVASVAILASENAQLSAVQ